MSRENSENWTDVYGTQSGRLAETKLVVISVVSLYWALFSFTKCFLSASPVVSSRCAGIWSWLCGSSQTYKQLHTNLNAARSHRWTVRKPLSLLGLHFSLVWETIVDEEVQKLQPNSSFIVMDDDDEELGPDRAQVSGNTVAVVLFCIQSRQSPV